MRTSSAFNQPFVEGFSSKPQPLPDGPEPYWVRYQHDRVKFYETFRSRQEELKRRFGSGPVSTSGASEPTLSERFWRHKENRRDREERASA